jgi:hypothetical protein
MQAAAFTKEQVLTDVVPVAEPDWHSLPHEPMLRRAVGNEQCSTFP